MMAKRTKRMAWEIAAILLLSVAAVCTTAEARLAGSRATRQTPVKVIRKASTFTVALAPALQLAVKRHFPGFRLARFDDYDAELVRNLAVDLKVTMPFACVGDFDGNGLTDAALLLTNRRHQWRLVAFHLTPDGAFHPHRIGPRQGFPEGLSDNPTGKIGFYLVRQPPGTVRYPRSSDPSRLSILHLGRDAILGEWSEEASRIFYFHRGRYRYVQQGD
jgi:hypothetical protein